MVNLSGVTDSPKFCGHPYRTARYCSTAQERLTEEVAMRKS